MMKEFLTAVELKEPEQVPVVLLFGCHFLSGFIHEKEASTYRNPDVKMRAHIAFQRRFPDLIFLPGGWPSYGVAGPEIEALGCKVEWPEEGGPAIREYIVKAPEDVEKLEVPDLFEHPITLKALREYEYMKKKTTEFDVNFGNAGIGPFDMAAQLRGVTQLMADLYLRPKMAHKLLSFTTKVVIKWLKAQDEVINGFIGFKVGDDLPGQLSLRHFELFALPSLEKVFKAFKGRIGIYHNDSDTTHLLEAIPRTGAKVFHFGFEVDAGEAKRRIGDKMCLLGNVPPLEVLAKGTPFDVKLACKKCILRAAPHGGYVLSAGGELVRGTPPENIEAMVKAAKEYGRYPIELNADEG